MAQTDNLGLETHPTGTVGLNDIVNSNWERLDEIFSAALTDADAAFNLIAAALLRDALSSMEPGETIAWDDTNGKFSRRKAQATLAFSATTDIDFLDGLIAPVQAISLTGNITFTTSNLQPGTRIQIAVACDGTLRTFTFPGDWTWIGSAAPASIAADKTGILRLTSTTTADTGVLAEWTVEP